MHAEEMPNECPHFTEEIKLNSDRGSLSSVSLCDAIMNRNILSQVGTALTISKSLQHVSFHGIQFIFPSLPPFLLSLLSSFVNIKAQKRFGTRSGSQGKKIMKLGLELKSLDFLFSHKEWQITALKAPTCH